MKLKLKGIMLEKCRDFGLSEQAIEALTELGSKQLNADSTDTDFIATADSLVPFAKAMQGEITRKMRTEKATQSDIDVQKAQSALEGVSKTASEGALSENVPAWAKSMMDAVNELKAENANRRKVSRAEMISEKAKNLGIPDYLMKRVSFADDCDLDKELAEYKQELVTNSLLPKQAQTEASSLEVMREQAKVWAESLPDKK